MSLLGVGYVKRYIPIPYTHISFPPPPSPYILIKNYIRANIYVRFEQVKCENVQNLNALKILLGFAQYHYVRI